MFSETIKDEDDVFKALKNHNVVKSTSELVIIEDFDGRLFITDGIQDVATVE